MKKLLSLILLTSISMPAFDIFGLGKDKSKPATEKQKEQTESTQPDYSSYTKAIDDAQTEINRFQGLINNRENELRQIDTRKDPKLFIDYWSIECQIKDLKKQQAGAFKNYAKAMFKIDFAINGFNRRTTEAALKLYHKEMGLALALVGTAAGLGYLGWQKYLKKDNAKTAKKA